MSLTTSERREIKFRAWNTELERFFYSYYDDDVNDGREYYPFGFAIGFKGDHHPKMILQQFTGLKDKNGKEIYEGDIFKARALARGVEDVYVVEYEAPHYWGNSNKGDLDVHYLNEYESIEVIGNLFENPELLKP